MRRTVLFLCLTGLLSLAPLAIAVAGDGYDLTWWSVDAGGGMSAGGGYALSGTIGQPDAGVMAGGDYTLAGGFWAGGQVPQLHLYQVILTLILQNWIPSP